MRKTRTRIGSILLVLAMLLSLLPVSALAVGNTIQVNNFSDLKDAAQNADKDTVVEVSGPIEMEEPVVFANPVKLHLESNAKITYESGTNSQVVLITLKNGSELAMAKGSEVAMIGDAESQNVYRDWRAIFSDGSLTVTQFEGTILVKNARGRGLYANNDLVFNRPVAGNVTMSNPNGDNRYVYGIVSYAGDVVLEQGMTKDAKITVDFGGGNTAAGIIAQSGNVVL